MVFLNATGIPFWPWPRPRTGWASGRRAPLSAPTPSGDTAF